jgi:hypothetical protein
MGNKYTINYFIRYLEKVHEEDFYYIDIANIISPKRGKYSTAYCQLEKYLSWCTYNIIDEMHWVNCGTLNLIVTRKRRLINALKHRKKYGVFMPDMFFK